MFFNKGNIFNQGNVYTFEEDAFIDSCEKAIERFKASPVNEKGIELQQKFTYKNTADKILDLIEKV